MKKSGEKSRAGEGSVSASNSRTAMRHWHVNLNRCWYKQHSQWKCQRHVAHCSSAKRCTNVLKAGLKIMCLQH